MNKAGILTLDSESFVCLLKERELPQLTFVSSGEVQQNIELVQDCNILIGEPRLIAKALPTAKQVEWVQSTFAGIEILCSPGLPKNYVLTGIKGVLGPLMSEYVFTYILALERRLLETHDNQQTAAWQEILHRGIQGLTLGVCGLGDIGNRIAQTARHFGMRVLGFSRSGISNPYAEQVFSGDSLASFLGQLDYLVITLPGTPQTHHFINYKALQQMKSSSVLINVGRGDVVVEQDLVHALQEGLIRFAVLDVFEKEPLPAENPLWKMTNVFITPHNAADVLPKDIVEIFAENYRRFLNQQSLRYVIDFERGY